MRQGVAIAWVQNMGGGDEEEEIRMREGQIKARTVLIYSEPAAGSDDHTA
jgi:hypothetical protein